MRVFLAQEGNPLLGAWLWNADGGWVCFHARWPYATAAVLSQAEHTSPMSDKSQTLEDWAFQALSESPGLKSAFYQLKFSTPYWVLRLGLFPFCVSLFLMAAGPIASQNTLGWNSFQSSGK